MQPSQWQAKQTIAPYPLPHSPNEMKAIRRWKHQHDVIPRIYGIASYCQVTCRNWLTAHFRISNLSLQPLPDFAFFIYSHCYLFINDSLSSHHHHPPFSPPHLPYQCHTLKHHVQVHHYIPIFKAIIIYKQNIQY